MSTSLVVVTQIAPKLWCRAAATTTAAPILRGTQQQLRWPPLCRLVAHTAPPSPIHDDGVRTNSTCKRRLFGTTSKSSSKSKSNNNNNQEPPSDSSFAKEAAAATNSNNHTNEDTNNNNNNNNNADNDNADNKDDESHLNWKERSEAPKWMQRIAPTKGGKWPPSPQEAVILASGLAVFVYSWTA